MYLWRSVLLMSQVGMYIIQKIVQAAETRHTLDSPHSYSALEIP
uniref:Uncharacterized protein n=1 Tax=Arundo donax TaxID=35708 RepID=A0A0A9HCB1_ARUDO